MKSHYAGLNPKSYRKWISKRRELSNPQKNILDGDLLYDYFNLSFNERNEISKKLKTSTDQVISVIN
jgi:cleavage and polyadenylation specificity factor subunit 1